MGVTRISGMYSGLDTDALVSSMLTKYQNKIDTYTKKQEKVEAKINTWNSLNSKIYSFYTSVLSKTRYESSYTKSNITSNNNAISVNSSSSDKSLKQINIKNMATNGYETGAKINNDVTNKSSLKDIGITSGDYEFNGKSISLDENDSIETFTNKLKKANVNVNFDESQNRFFVSAQSTGKNNDFDLTNSSSNLLKAMGLNKTYYIGEDGEYYKDKTLKDKVSNDELNSIKNGEFAIKSNGKDANITINGAYFTNDTNTFKIDGLEFTINNETKDTITINSSSNKKDITNNIENLVNEYNNLIKELSTYYQEKKVYDPLTEKEKDSMTDRQIEKWEDKVKETSLGNDKQLYSVIQKLRNAMQQGVKMSDGSTKYLSDFGISSVNYLSAASNEKYNLTINNDKLSKAIDNNSDEVIEFFSNLSSTLYDNLTTSMKSTDFNSMYKMYNDKQMINEKNSYDTMIAKWQTKMDEMEKKYYKQFAAMETAMAKMQSNTNALSSLFNSFS